MGVIKCNVFKIEYKESNSSYEQSMLVLADSIEEAMSIFQERYPKFNIVGVHTYVPVIRRTTKTITVEL